MKPNTAIGFILSGMALYLINPPPSIKNNGLKSGLKTLACFFALMVIFLGIITMMEYALNWNSGIDRVLINWVPNIPNPGRMAFNSALNFVLIGLALLLMDVECFNGKRPAQWLIAIESMIALMALVGYLHNISALYGDIFVFNPMTLNSVFAFMLVAISGLLVYPDQGFMVALIEGGIGGAVARRSLVAALLVPIALDALTLAGERCGLYDSNIRDAIFIMFITAAIAIFVLKMSRQLSRMEMEQQKDVLELNKKIIESSSVGIFACHADGPCIIANPAVARISGATVEQMLELNYKELNNWKINGLYDKVELALKTRQDQQAETHLTSAFGKDIWINYYITTFIYYNELHFLIMTEDITKRKLAEQRITSLMDFNQKILDISPVGILTFLSEGPCVSANEEACRIVGARHDQLLAQNFFHIRSWQKSGLLELAKQALSEECEKSGVINMVTTFGKHIWVDCHLIPFISGDDRHLLLTFVDITEQKLAEDSLKVYTGRLERSNRDLQEFAYVASHDLQEPLRKIQAFGDRLVSKYSDKLDETGRDYIKRMSDASKRMQILINGLLTFSRVGTHAQSFEKVNLSDVVKEALIDLEDRILQTGGKVELFDLPEINCDPAQIQQLFQNLIGNALKFHHPDRNPLIKITAELTENICTVHVEDNGIGFEQQYVERIFKPFQRLHSRDEYEGTGMGLAICRRIVERHGGTISANARPEGGAAFIFSIP
ncbi:MAG: ATP-binding protein, partial [Anaerolineae bacterium]|nr:ATP-binding protein [Anaerolineae bacterium]